MCERDVFIEALQRTDPAERATYLDQACINDEPLRRRVERLLVAHAGASDLLKAPAPFGAPTSEVRPQPSGDSARQSAAEQRSVQMSTEDFSAFPGSDFDRKMLSGDERSATIGKADGNGHFHTRLFGTAGIAEFELLDELGHGGMGVVYKAWHRQLNRMVALKMIVDGKHAQPEYLKRFLNEAQAEARLHHPNIVQIYDIGEDHGCPYVILEMLEGGTLADSLKRTTQPNRAAARLVETLASAVHQAHQAGIVHRDLKPANVLFDRDGTPKIADFGLAKWFEVDQSQTQTQTHTGEIMGTSSYMAPEQAQGDVHKIGPRTDIYALGAILYEVLTGRPPFKGASQLETLHQVVFDDVVPPSRIQPRIARDLETICLKCLQKEPQKRYGTALELADDLTRYLENKPIRARRTPLSERAVKWTRRRPVTAILLALSVVLAMALAGAGLWWREYAHVEKLRSDVDPALLEVQGLLKEEQWDDARVVVEKTLTLMRDEPRLADRKNRALALLDQAIRGRAQQDVEAKAGQHYRHFVALRKEALFQQTRYNGLDSSASAAETRRVAREALDIFAAPGARGNWTLAVLPASLSDRERAEIKEGCYELLLILAEVMDSPEEGLEFLARAARLDPTPRRAYLLRRAACLSRRGDAQGAEHARSEAEQIQPASALDHFLTGQERFNNRDPSAARQHFKTALRLQPDHFAAHCLTAVCCLQLNEPGEATPELTACLMLEPDFPWLYVLRGFALTLIAADERNEAARRAPTQEGARRADERPRFRAAEHDFEQASILLEHQPADGLRYELLIYRGFLRFQEGNLDTAAADLLAAVKLNDRDPRAFVTLARVEQDLGDPDEAIKYYGRAIEANRDFAPLYRGRADVDLGRHDLTPEQRARALSNLDQAIAKAAPGDPVVARDHTNRARLLHLEGRDQEALDACAAAVQAAPKYTRAHLLRLQILLDLKRYGDLLESCEALLAQGVTSPELYELRALVRAKQGQYADAIEDATKALGLRPDQTSLLTRRGQLYLITQAPTLALRDFNRAFELDPANSDALLGRAEVYVRRGDYHLAAADLETALEGSAPNAHLAYNAARIYMLAAQAAAPEVRRRTRDAVAQGYEDRAVELVIEAIRLTPPERRAEFLRDQIQGDPALQPILPRLRLRLNDRLPVGESVRTGAGNAPQSATLPPRTRAEATR
jgi:serine/threonine protein kinase/tetratricopeptide (TPR) repeat protein